MNISFEDFAKVEIKIGTVLNAKRVEESNKLLKLKVDFNEDTPRTIFSGIAKFFNPEDLIGKQLPFIINLEPKKIMGELSEGMLLACELPNGSAVLLLPQKEVPKGTPVI